jgi:multiple sugar transport system ATP-binding protein
MAAVRLNAVSKRFGSVVAVREVTLEVADREFLVIVGPSGCGKTTTLRMLAGLESASSGDIYIGERRVNDVEPKDRDIAMVFQNYALYPHMTVRENLAFGLRLRHTPRPEVQRRVQQAAEALGIGDLLDRRPRQLSGGQRQRVALGRAIVRRPAVFLMDEPLSNLDAKLRVQMRAELQKLHRRVDTTFIYVTHDQTEAMTMGQRIVVMRDGVVQQVAAPQALYDEPVNLFVAGFVGSPPINVLRGALEVDDGRARVAGEGLRVTLPRVPRSAGPRVLLGVRPEDVRIEPAFVAAHPETRLETSVDVVEPLGAEQHVHLTAGPVTLVARAASDLRLTPGQPLAVALNPEKLHLFDAETEARLT